MSRHAPVGGHVIKQQDLRRALRGIPARWALRLVCAGRDIPTAELFEAARAEGDEQAARELAVAQGWDAAEAA